METYQAWPEIPQSGSVIAELDELGFLFALIEWGNASQIGRSDISVDGLYERYGRLMHSLEDLARYEHAEFRAMRDVRLKAMRGPNNRNRLIIPVVDSIKDPTRLWEKLNLDAYRGRIVADLCRERMCIVPINTPQGAYQEPMRLLRQAGIDQATLERTFPEAFNNRPQRRITQEQIIINLNELLGRLDDSTRERFFQLYDGHVEPVHYEHLKTAVVGLENLIRKLEKEDSRWALVPQAPWEFEYRGRRGKLNTVASTVIGDNSNTTIIADILSFPEGTANQFLQDTYNRLNTNIDSIKDIRMMAFEVDGVNYWISQKTREGQDLVLLISAPKTASTSIAYNNIRAIMESEDIKGIMEMDYVPHRLAVPNGLRPISRRSTIGYNLRILEKILWAKVVEPDLKSEDHYKGQSFGSMWHYRAFHTLITMPLPTGGISIAETQLFTPMGLYHQSDLARFGKAAHRQFIGGKYGGNVPQLFPTRDTGLRDRTYLQDLGDELNKLKTAFLEGLIESPAKRYDEIIIGYAEHLASPDSSALKDGLVELMNGVLALPVSYIRGASLKDFDDRKAQAEEMHKALRTVHSLFAYTPYNFSLENVVGNMDSELRKTIERLAGDALKETLSNPPFEEASYNNFLYTALAWMAVGRGDHEDEWSRIKQEYGFSEMAREGRSIEIAAPGPLIPMGFGHKPFRRAYRMLNGNSFGPIMQLAGIPHDVKNGIISAACNLMDKLGYAP